jgi:hypothetical protein
MTGGGAERNLAVFFGQPPCGVCRLVARGDIPQFRFVPSSHVDETNVAECLFHGLAGAMGRCGRAHDWTDENSGVLVYLQLWHFTRHS